MDFFPLPLVDSFAFYEPAAGQGLNEQKLYTLLASAVKLKINTHLFLRNQNKKSPAAVADGA